MGWNPFCKRYVGLICTSLDQFKQTTLDKFGQVWTSLGKFGKFVPKDISSVFEYDYFIDISLGNLGLL